MLALIGSLAEVVAYVGVIGGGAWGFFLWSRRHVYQPFMARLDERRQRAERTHQRIKDLHSGLESLTKVIGTNGGKSVFEVLEQQNDDMARITSLPDLISTPIIDADKRGVVYFVNRAFREWTDCQLEDVQGANWLALIAESHREAFLRDLTRAREHGSVLERRVPLTDRGGRALPPIIVRVEPLKSKEKITGWRTTLRLVHEGPMN